MVGFEDQRLSQRVQSPPQISRGGLKDQGRDLSET